MFQLFSNKVKIKRAVNSHSTSNSLIAITLSILTVLIATVPTISFAILDTPVKTNGDVEKYLDNMNNYSADFKQVVYQNNDEIQSSSGKVTLKKPFRFKWDYTSPNSMQILSDGKNFFQYDIKLKQVSVKPVQDLANTGILPFLNSSKKIKSIFDIKLMSDAEIESYKKFFKDDVNKKALNYFMLKPKKTNLIAKKKESVAGKSEESTIDEFVILGFNENNLSFVLFSDSYGVTNFYFTNIIVNKNINNQIFELKVSDDVDILGDII